MDRIRLRIPTMTSILQKSLQLSRDCMPRSARLLLLTLIVALGDGWRGEGQLAHLALGGPHHGQDTGRQRLLVHSCNIHSLYGDQIRFVRKG
jgi:hypothetical protein